MSDLEERIAKTYEEIGKLAIQQRNLFKSIQGLQSQLDTTEKALTDHKVNLEGLLTEQAKLKPVTAEVK